jgi:PAS domain S-box-containing protein
MHGYTPEELIGKYYTDLVAPESLDDVRKIYEKRVSDGESKKQYLFFRLHKDGRALPTENRVTVSFYQGQVAGIGICRDITERVEIERRIRAAESLAHIGELTTSLAHEIRNPLSAAKMSIQMLLKSPAREEKDKRRLDILSKEISRLDRIVTEMLDFAKPMKLEFSQESLPDIVDSCLEVVDARIKEKGISVKKRFQKGLSRVFIDREKVEQAMINLLLNSMDAVSSNGEITIRIRHARGDRSVQIEISDDGVGISAEDMPYLFDPFYSKKAKGTGLGLANVKKIIEAHGGSVGVLPRSPRGARFMASVPLKHEETSRREKENEVFLK